MRILLFVTDLQRGGAPLRLARLARGLRAVGEDVVVGCLAPPGPVGADLERAGVPTFACGARHAKDFTALWRFARHIRHFNPALIHATLTHANVAARLVGRGLRVPVLTSTATLEVERRWHRFAERLTGRLDCGHVVNSQTLARHVARAFRVPPARIYVVPPAIDAPPRLARADARRQLGLSEEEFVVLWAGRFDPVKRLDLLVRCAERLRARSFRFLLAGDGPARPAVETLIRASGAPGAVTLLGWQEDLGPALSAADVFFFPSRTEGLPNAVLTAMAFGLPVVGSDIPALRELAGAEEPDSQKRLLLIAADQPGPFADALEFLRDRPDPRAALGRRAADWARPYCGPHPLLRATLDIYRRVARN